MFSENHDVCYTIIHYLGVGRMGILPEPITHVFLCTLLLQYDIFSYARFMSHVKMPSYEIFSL